MQEKRKVSEKSKHAALKMEAGNARKRPVDLKTYISNHTRAIRAPTHKLNTIEDTNTRVGAVIIR